MTSGWWEGVEEPREFLSGGFAGFAPETKLKRAEEYKPLRPPHSLAVDVVSTAANVKWGERLFPIKLPLDEFHAVGSV